MGKGHKKRSSSSSSSSSSSDGGHGNPNKMNKRRAKYEAKMRKTGRCVCHHCPQGVMACQDNFMKKYQSHGMASGSYGGGAMYGQPGLKPNYPTAGVPYQQPGMIPPNPAQYHGGMMPGQGSVPYGQPGSVPYVQPGSVPYNQSGVMPGMAPMMPGNPYPQGGTPGQIPPYGNTPGMPGQPPFY